MTEKRQKRSGPGYKFKLRLNNTQDSSQRANSWLLTFCLVLSLISEVQKAVFVSLNFQYF